MINKEQIESKLTLIGAGPGDPELFTIKGMKALEKADVVMYDALVNKDLLDYAPNAVKFYVGKRKGLHYLSQDQINEKIVEFARTHKNVVRLKGGDPFVFGRGTEETDYAEQFGIETETISGITSAISVPASVGISVTKRYVSESFFVVTATTSKFKMSDEIYTATKVNGTVVILMGIHKLPKIVSVFQEEGKGQLPVAVIQEGTRENEKYGVGIMDNIVEIVEEKELGAPGIIVIGEVVRESSKLKEYYECFLENEI
ncbi:uroporphyrinogen-III C-methyltransferase [Aureivirga sp. CE67]|uniref:uroporphyrinogen-III C-methyltransferase n=1 Tax=Aureivirga sp. CE67 TaxID=1788983 RepID=UPI0018C90B6F|nr:uroporphyrinogen-III C-methyltransferase [Aureivirga sp. CE67]